MNFGVGTFRVRIYFWPNLNPPLEHLIKVVLIRFSVLLVQISLGAISHKCVSFRLSCTLLAAGQVIIFDMENSNLVVVLKFKRPFKMYRGLMLHVRGFACMFPQNNDTKRKDVRNEEK